MLTAFSNKVIKVIGFELQLIPGLLIFSWIYIQVKAYGLMLPQMQIGVLVLGFFMALFSIMSIKATVSSKNSKKIE